MPNADHPPPIPPLILLLHNLVLLVSLGSLLKILNQIRHIVIVIVIVTRPSCVARTPLILLGNLLEILQVICCADSESEVIVHVANDY